MSALSRLTWLLIILAGTIRAKDLRFAVLVSANAEWRAVKPLFATATIETSPYGEYFFASIERERVLFSKVDGAKWQPPDPHSTLSIISIRRG